ncbi:MAG: hypothetical protein CMH83_23495 [Nocardioides sp.]|nr:hypothetical protein [Nocardioides sp.]
MVRRSAIATSGDVVPEAARLVDVARLAPSIGNTQPWAWRLDGRVLDLHAVLRRRLADRDPSGRHLLASCGVALHHALLAAREHRVDVALESPDDAGWARVGEALDGTAHPDVAPRVARLVLGTTRSTAADGSLVLRSLRQRSTDRRRFTSWPVSDSVLGQVAEVAHTPLARVVPVTGRVTRLRVQHLVNRIGLGTDPDAGATPATVGGTDDVHPGDGLLVMATDEDRPRDWFDSGRALGGLWLAAQAQGLTVVPISRAVESHEVRQGLAHGLLDSGHVQALVRTGWQPLGRAQLARTARHSLDEVLRPGTDPVA